MTRDKNKARKQIDPPNKKIALITSKGRGFQRISVTLVASIASMGRVKGGSEDTEPFMILRAKQHYSAKAFK